LEKEEKEMPLTERGKRLDYFLRDLYRECCAPFYSLHARLEDVKKIVEFLKANGLDPEVIEREMKTLVGDNFAFVEGLRIPTEGEGRWDNWNSDIPYEMFLAVCYKFWQ